MEAIFDSSTNSQSSGGIDIKSELVFYTSKTNDSERYKVRTNQYLNDDYRYRKFPSSRGRNNRQKQNVENYDQWGQKTDPPGKSGNISRCPIFQSIYHWANDCPNKRKEE